MIRSGIYMITNRENGRTYYGSTNNLKKRQTDHFYALHAGSHSNCFLQADYLKCGAGAFVFDVLEITTGSKEERLGREQVYLDKYWDGGKRCYNLKMIASSPDGCVYGDKDVARLNRSNAQLGKHHSDETKAKISALRKGKMSQEHREMYSRLYTGVPRTDETKAKISRSNKGRRPSDACIAAGILLRTGKALSPAHSLALSLSHMRIWQFKNENDDLVTVDNLKLFCLENSLSYKCMCRVGAGITKKRHHGYGGMLP